MVEDNIRDKKGRFKPGHANTHGAFKKKLPVRLKHEAAAYRLAIVKDLGGESNISAARLILIEKAMHLYAVTRSIENYINDRGCFRGKGHHTRLEPVLANNYTNYVNSLRLILREIGIEPVRAEQRLDPLQIVADCEAGLYDEEIRQADEKLKE